MLKIKRFVAPLLVVVLLSIAGLNVYGQCGVYLKRGSTWALPYARVYLDRAADMTGDGLPDLLASQVSPTHSSGRSRIFIIPNLGNGNFGPPSTILEPPSTTPFSDTYNAVNVNGDAFRDLIVRMGGTGATMVVTFINNGNGTYTTGPTISSGTSLVLPDVDGDGFGDTIDSSTSDLNYQSGNGDGTFDPPVTILTGHGGIPGDFNGDGKLDFLDFNHLHLNNGNMTWGSIDVSAVMGGITIWGMDDFNADGKLDILTSNTAGSLNFGILTSTGTGFTQVIHSGSTEPGWQGYPRIGDWGGNSAQDIIFEPRFLNKKVVFINDGAGNFTKQIYNGRVTLTNWQQSVMADFDNDGKTDLVLSASYITNNRIFLVDVTSFTFEKNVCDQPGQPRIVDYDYSNTTDYSFWNPATGDWSRRTIATASGAPSTTETVNFGLGSFGDVPAPGDFDGDGVTDRAVYRDSTGFWYVRRSADLIWYVIPFGLTGDKPVVADYDGDGISDIALWRPSTGDWHIWYMGPQQYGAVHFGATGDKPTPADYDGDFKTDVAVYRPSTGAWYYLKSSDLTWLAYQWGISTDRPIPADYDGDGKADIAVHRESDRVAYILRSSTGAASYYQFGIVGDIFQVGDYDGDYVADLGVYRPSQGSWWTTQNPFGMAQSFGTAGVVPTSSTLKGE